MSQGTIRSLTILAGLLTSLAGCGGDELPTTAPLSPVLTRDTEAPFQTDSLSYTLNAGTFGYGASLTITYTNTGTSATAFTNCSGATMYVFQKLVDGVWQSAWSPIVNSCLSPPIVVPPGGTHIFKVALFGGYEGCNCAPRFFVGDPNGTYRAVWQTGFTALPEAARVSNRFTFVASPARRRGTHTSFCSMIVRPVAAIVSSAGMSGRPRRLLASSASVVRL
jgi:hypothetical protein